MALAAVCFAANGPEEHARQGHSAKALAIECLREARGSDRKHALLHAATALSGAGLFYEAIEAIDSIEDRGDRSYWARLTIALDLFDTGEFEAGRVMLAKATDEVEAAFGALNAEFVPCFQAAYGPDKTLELLRTIESDETRTLSILELGEQQVEDSESAYVVRAGDTLGQIAHRVLGRRSRWREIRELNPGLDPQRLSPGVKLALPDGVAFVDPPLDRILELLPAQLADYPSKLAAARAAVLYMKLGELRLGQSLARSIVNHPLSGEDEDHAEAVGLLMGDKIEQGRYKAAEIAVLPLLTAVRSAEAESHTPTLEELLDGAEIPEPSAPHVDDLLLELVEGCAEGQAFELAENILESIECDGCLAEARTLLGIAIEAAAVMSDSIDPDAREAQKRRGRALLEEARQSTLANDTKTAARMSKRLAWGFPSTAHEYFDIAERELLKRTGDDIGCMSEFLAREASAAAYFRLPLDMARRGYAATGRNSHCKLRPADHAERIAMFTAEDAARARDFEAFGLVLQLREDDDFRARVIRAGIDGSADIARNAGERELYSASLAAAIRDLEDSWSRVTLLSALVRSGLPARARIIEETKR